MTELKKLSIIIPAYNEEGTIEELIQKVRSISLNGLEKEIIVVDDGSRDKTRDILNRIAGIQTFFHESNQGKGGALKTGIKKATGDVLIIQDADLEYDPEDYPVVLEPILSGEADMVMGSRFLKSRPKFFTKDGDPFFSHCVANMMIVALTNLLYQCRFSDYEGCYKAFTKELTEKIPIETNGFDFDNELICKSLRRGFKIVEVPISYKPRLYSEGKKIGFKDAIDIFTSIMKWRFLSF